jgi:hypothetical protein
MFRGNITCIANYGCASNEAFDSTVATDTPLLRLYPPHTQTPTHTIWEALDATVALNKQLIVTKKVYPPPPLASNEHFNTHISSYAGR